MDFGVQEGRSVGGNPVVFGLGFVKFLALGWWVSLKLWAFDSISRENLEQVQKAAILLVFGYPPLRLRYLAKDQNCDNPDEQC